MPYIKRAGQLHNTLVSFCHYYSHRKDFQVVIIEDHKNFINVTEHELLSKVIDIFKTKINILHLHDLNVDVYNPAPLFNLGAKNSESEFIVLTSPECFHSVDILKGFDTEDPSTYVLCACQNFKHGKLWINNFSEFTGTTHEWYQHSKHRNASFHFCSRISRSNWDKIGGFDERFKNGIAYEDDYFRDRVIAAKILFIKRDDLFIKHIDHGGFQKPPNYETLLAKNQSLHIELRII